MHCTSLDARRAIRAGVAGDLEGNGTLPQVTDFLRPQRGDFLWPFQRRQREAVVALHGVGLRANAWEALQEGEHDAAVGVVVGLGLILARDGELDAVDGFEVGQG